MGILSRVTSWFKAKPAKTTKKLRLWRLGDLDRMILPTEEAIHRLASILDKWDGESPFDLVWGPEISVEQIDLETNAVDIIVPVDTEFRNKEDKTGLELLVSPQIRIITKDK